MSNIVPPSLGIASFTATIMLAMAFTQSFAQEKGSFTDHRDKKTYKTVKIGEQTWMAENFRYATKGSKCYNNKEENCQKYGRLYDWETAMKACPKGWHLPSREEWNSLNFGDSETMAGKKLKAASGWDNDRNGLDIFGFAALPGGFGFSFDVSDDYFFGAGYYGYWWSSFKFGYYAFYRHIYDYEDAYWLYGDEKYLFSVRCVQD